ncbi:hypothetical protein CS022_08290 [Veronia nyctiphanis]|uniref:Uncharacterized protein n=1 Tax=Veronia nyctiphanis TaxID=1278244 RepID=A0A4Q0YXD2_9GAMM|nr:hypothetical protein [Veronia nyctiphanis]RXJ73721.1 hypothetical protein CS022_08290 [Veronia nyctiphanis]
MWVTLDFESSGLSDESYPIEVGYSLPDGTSYSLLIDPHSSAEQWVSWDQNLEEYEHGISRSELETRGLPVQKVCRHLNENLFCYDHILCDSQWDLFWLGRLYRAAHMRPSFTLKEVGHWLNGFDGVCREDFASAISNLTFIHRAEPDAKCIRRALSSVLS